MENPQFEIDLHSISLDRFESDLLSRDMIPSRKMLKDDLGKRFEIIKGKGISTMADLLFALKTAQKIDSFSSETGIPGTYLVLLNREIKSYLSKPVRLDKFSGINGEWFGRLERAGIKNSRQLLFAIHQQGLETLSVELSIPVAQIQEMAGLADLSRAYGVGPAFARMLFDLGLHTMNDFVRCSPDSLVSMYEDQTGKKADFGINEMQFSLSLARELDLFL